MLIIGCDYHPSVQQIAFVDTETGECQERRLRHCAEAEHFYRALNGQGLSVRVGIEATGQSRWFERLLTELNFELWIGDPARIRAKQVRKQKNDRMDAAHLLKLMLKDDFPRIWVPSPENRDVRQLVWHRHRLVQMRLLAVAFACTNNAFGMYIRRTTPTTVKSYFLPDKDVPIDTGGARESSGQFTGAAAHPVGSINAVQMRK
jgi:transposase